MAAVPRTIVSCFKLVIKLHLVCLLTLLQLHVLHSVECLELWAWRLQRLRHILLNSLGLKVLTLIWED
jgi:hypothetical protein